jgi:hypothetical protein
MAFSPIAFIAPNYSDYGTYFLKAYLPGSTTPKPLAIDLAGTTTFAKLQLNVDGFFKSAGGAVITPYVDGAYDAYLFETEAEADANNTAGAIRLADNILPLSDQQLRADLADGSADVNLDSDLSQAYVFNTVAEMTIVFPAGKRLYIKERDAYFTFNVGGTFDGFGTVDAGNGNTATTTKLTPKAFGADITATTASDGAYSALLVAANNASEPFDMQSAKILLATDKIAPNFGFIGDGELLGSKITIDVNNRDFKQTGGNFKLHDVRFSGCFYARTDFTEMDFGGGGGIITIDGKDNTHGSFWNHFNYALGDIKINVDDTIGQSVNQNLFTQTRGGVEIFGGSAGNPNPQECDQNLFQMIDTTGANITDPTDGTTGWHMLNRSYMNQNNVIQHLYMEGTGSRAIKGNFHTQRVYSDGNGSAYATNETCHHIFNGDHNIRNTHDHFSANPKANMAIGGLWDVLNAGNNGQPFSFVQAGGLSASVVQALDTPMGFNYKYGGSSEINFASLRINLENSFSGRYGLSLLLQVVGPAGISMQLENNGSPRSMDTSVYHDMGNNWRLYRLSFEARNDKQREQFTIFFRGGTGNPCECHLAGVWASPAKSTFVPSAVPYTDISAITDSGSISTVPLALPVGGRVHNYNPSLAAPATIEWVKLADLSVVAINSIT